MRLNSDKDLRDLERRYLEAASQEERDQVFTKAAQVSRRLGAHPSCDHCLVFLEWKDGLCRACSPHFSRSNPDEDLRDLERRERHDPEASRRARLTRIRLGQPRPSDLILMQLPEAAQVAFDHDEDWSDRIYLPGPSFAPGQPSELEVILEPEGPGSLPEFYRRRYEEAYEVESSRWSYKERPAVIGETHVYSESNGIWEGLGSDERRDVDETTVEDMYGPTPSGQPRRPRTHWLDRRMWMRSWEPYDEHVLDTGNDPIGAYGLDDPENGPSRIEDRRRLARCRLRALLYSSTTPEEYFALVGEAGLKWCSERTGQWHHWNPRRRNSDEILRALERAARTGGVSDQAKLLSWRLRKGEVPERNVRVAALMGVPEAEFVLGLKGLSPEQARDQLVLLLDTSQSEYAVLWAWASAHAALEFSGLPALHPMRDQCVEALALVESWLEDPMSERVYPCRHVAYLLTEGGMRADAGVLDPPLAIASTAFAALSVNPWHSDFPVMETDHVTGVPFRFPGNFLPNFMIPLLPRDDYGLRDVFVGRDLVAGDRVVAYSGGPLDLGTGVVIFSAPTPSLARPIPEIGRNMLPEAMAVATERVPTILVRPDVAVASHAHLAAVWSMNPQSETGLTAALDVIAGAVARRVRPWLLGQRLGNAFKYGREALSGLVRM